MLLVWHPLIYSREGFPRDDEGKPFLPSDSVKEALVNAVLYYFIKKDKEIESKVRAFLLRKGFSLDEAVDALKSMVFEKYPVLDGLNICERIYLPEDRIYRTPAEVFDLERWIDVDDFVVEVFRGRVELSIESPGMDKLKAACHSYCEALARMEMSMLKDHPLVERFYNPFLNELKKWDVPLRVGMWTEEEFRAKFLFFWRIKDVREALKRELKTDIRPRRVIYLPREGCTAGWCEFTTNNSSEEV